MQPSVSGPGRAATPHEVVASASVPGEDPAMVLVDLERDARTRALPILKESFVGIYRWHAKRTLNRIATVRALERSGEVVGASLLEQIVPEVGYVYYIFVGSADRRKGFGGLLLDDALATFRAKGAKVAYAAVEEENRASQELFRGRGFRDVDRTETSYREGGLGAQGLRSRMMVVYGEILLGIRLSPSAPGKGDKAQC